MFSYIFIYIYFLFYLYIYLAHFQFSFYVANSFVLNGQGLLLLAIWVSWISTNLFKKACECLGMI